MKHFALLILGLVFLSIATKAEVGKSDTLKVAVKHTPPFIIKDGKTYSGLSIKLWEKIAGDLQLQYVYQEYDLQGLLDALKNGDVDICINPLSATSQRMEDFNFTQPFYISNLCIAVNSKGGHGLFAVLKKFFSADFLKVVLLLLFVILIFGFLFWMAERKKNQADFRTGFKGIFDGLWLSAVTMTTVGYGDKAPKTTLGRAIGLIWMFTAIIIISGFTAGIASALTVDKLESSIEKLADLQKTTVGTLSKSSAAYFLKNKDIHFIGFERVEEGLTKLGQGEIEAFVYDEPIVRYYIGQSSFDLEVLPLKFDSQYYGFSMPYSNQMIHQINPILLQFIESDQWKYIKNQYGL